MNFIVIDGGTTNTRVALIQNDNIIKKNKIPYGAGSSVDIKSHIKNEINLLLTSNNLSEQEIEYIIVSGMLTSELGLLEVPHIKTPVGIAELASKTVITKIKDITSIPFFFIPGVKNNIANPYETDFMRGEETELFGINDDCLNKEKLLVILPGSHTKFIVVENGKITKCTTTLLGEMFSALATNTILKKSIPMPFPIANSEYLIKGFDFSNKFGVSKTLFHTRILDKTQNLTSEQLTGFYLGAIATADINLINEYLNFEIFVGGSSALRDLFKTLILHAYNKEITDIGENSEQLQIYGALKIFKAHSHKDS